MADPAGASTGAAGAGAPPARPTAALPPLTPDQEQVLAFVIPYHRDNGCLPSVSETAQACGYRSLQPVVRTLSELEQAGVIERDPAHARLGAIALDPTPPMMTWDRQHWMAVRERAEQLALLRSVRDGLGWAPTLAAIGALHREGSSRLVMIEAYDSLIERLRPLHPGDERDDADLATIGELIEGVFAAAFDWPSYCLIRLVWTRSAQEYLGRSRPLEFGYVGAVEVAMRRRNEAIAAFYASAVRAGQAADPRYRPVLDGLVTALTRLREVDSGHVGSPGSFDRVDLFRLLDGTAPA